MTSLPPKAPLSQSQATSVNREDMCSVLDDDEQLFRVDDVVIYMFYKVIRYYLFADICKMYVKQ